MVQHLANEHKGHIQLLLVEDRLLKDVVLTQRVGKEDWQAMSRLLVRLLVVTVFLGTVGHL